MAAVFQWAHDGGSPGFVMSVYVCECVCEDLPEWISGRWVTENGECRVRQMHISNVPEQEYTSYLQTHWGTRGRKSPRRYKSDMMCKRERWSVGKCAHSVRARNESFSPLEAPLSHRKFDTYFSHWWNLYVTSCKNIHSYDAEIHCSCREKL